MARRRKDAVEGIPSLLRRFFGESETSATLLLISVVLAFLAVGTYLAWDRFGGYVLSQPVYRLSAESIEMSAQPSWIAHTDVKQESILSGSLLDLNVRQADVTLRVAQAFSMHPWVRKVKHVSKRYPARVIVDVDYRQPVGMVEIEGRFQGRNSVGYLPIDADGVLLPTADFSTDAADQYLVISAGGSAPMSKLAGTAWGDDRVVGAAQVAGFLQPYGQQLELRKVIAYRGPNDAMGKSDCYFVILTRSGTTIIWGRAPGQEHSGEPVAEQKITRLQEFAQQRGSLDVLEPGQTIDLRRGDRLSVATLPDDFAK